jgi:hypothetical protein
MIARRVTCSVRSTFNTPGITDVRAETYWQPAAPLPGKSNLPDFPEPDEAGKSTFTFANVQERKNEVACFGIAAAASLLGGGVSLVQSATQGTAPSGSWVLIMCA